MLTTTVTAPDAAALHAALSQRPELQPIEDELGNPQTPFRILAGEVEDDWIVEHPDAVAASLIEDAAAASLGIFATMQAAAAAAEQRDTNAAAIRDDLVAGLATLDAHLAAMTGGAPTNAQVRDAVIFNLRATKRLARLMLGALDSAD